MYGLEFRVSVLKRGVGHGRMAGKGLPLQAVPAFRVQGLVVRVGQEKGSGFGGEGSGCGAEGSGFWGEGSEFGVEAKA